MSSKNERKIEEVNMDYRHIQFHFFTSFPPSLLNRDEAGLAKRTPYGDAYRTRISSQCLKYHWRHDKSEYSLSAIDDAQLSLRSRQTFEYMIATPLIEKGYPEKLVVATIIMVQYLMFSGKIPYNSKENGWKKIRDAMSGESDPESILETAQITVLGHPEIEYLRRFVSETVDSLQNEMGELWNTPSADVPEDKQEIVIDTLQNVSQKELRENLKGLYRATGLDAAMFGRMATSDYLATSEAAIHVGHAFTVHEEQSESDDFVTSDDIKVLKGQPGTSHLNSMELNQGLFYGYAFVDLPVLISNLEGCKQEDWKEVDHTLAAEVMKRLTHLMCTVSPGAKRGGTAPYARAQFLLVEAGVSSPRSLGDAFFSPVEKGDILQDTCHRVASFIGKDDNVCGNNVERVVSGVNGDMLADKLNIKSHSLSDVADWIAEKVKE